MERSGWDLETFLLKYRWQKPMTLLVERLLTSSLQISALAGVFQSVHYAEKPRLPFWGPISYSVFSNPSPVRFWRQGPNSHFNLLLQNVRPLLSDTMQAFHFQRL